MKWTKKWGQQQVCEAVFYRDAYCVFYITNEPRYNITMWPAHCALLTKNVLAHVISFHCFLLTDTNCMWTIVCFLRIFLTLLLHLWFLANRFTWEVFHRASPFKFLTLTVSKEEWKTWSSIQGKWNQIKAFYMKHFASQLIHSAF